MQIVKFGIPFDLNETTFEAKFPDGIVHEEFKTKNITEIKHLYYNEDKINQSQIAYSFYANLYSDEYKELFNKYGYTNGITVVMPGTVAGEAFKNSGHYHQLKPGQTHPNMEAYEVLLGKAAFILQKAKNFDNENEELLVEDCLVIIAKEGEKVIIPPFYGHCVVNIGEGPMIFGNIAAPCPLNYDVINKHKGFFAYVFKENDTTVLVQNENYKDLPKIRVIKAVEATELGIDFNLSLNESFVRDPEKFRFLDKPEEFEERVLELYGGTK